MSMQIMPARISGKNILYDEQTKIINMTDALRTICDDYFVEKNVLEDDEEITVKVVKGSQIKELSERLEKEIILALEKIKITRGEDAKSEIASNIKDYVLLRSIIIASLLSSKLQELVIIIC